MDSLPKNNDAFVTADPEILGGTPCFTGTRVPVKILFENFAAGLSLAEILDSYLSIDKKVAIKALKEAQWLLEHSVISGQDRSLQNIDKVFRDNQRSWLVPFLFINALQAAAVIYIYVLLFG